VSHATRWTAPDGRWTEQDLHRFPQDGHRYEIVDGCLHVTPPSGPHDALVGALISALREAAPKGWCVFARLGIAAGASNLIPDVTVLRPRSSGAVWCDPVDVALVVEVETAESSRYDRLLKPTLYGEAGIADFWRVEAGPALRVYRLDPDGVGYAAQHHVQGDELIKLDHPFPVRVAPSTWS
jgi:Uma2 family endonuclease